MTEGAGIWIAREHDRTTLHRALRKGQLERLRHGAYRVVDDAAGPEYASDEVAQIKALDRQLRADHWFSHLSAANVWGLRRWRPPARIHVVQGYRASGRAAPDVERHFVDLPIVQRARRHGIPVTSLARTVVDCATTLHPLEGLVVADAARARGLVLDEAFAVLDGLGRVRGARRARLVLGLSDGGAESAWESWLRYVGLRAGLPRPETQLAVVTRLGTFRADLGWPTHGVLAEFDGRVKYRDGAFGPGYDADDARFQEKRRADAIEEATGWAAVRVTAVDPPDDVARRLVRRFPAELRRSLRPNPLLPPVPGR